MRPRVQTPGKKMNKNPKTNNNKKAQTREDLPLLSLFLSQPCKDIARWFSASQDAGIHWTWNLPDPPS
jgi:hypothetical protein